MNSAANESSSLRGSLYELHRRVMVAQKSELKGTALTFHLQTLTP